MAYIEQLHDKRKVVMTAGIDITEHKEIEARLSQQKATEEIKEYAGLQYDPEVARIFIEMVPGKKW